MRFEAVEAKARKRPSPESAGLPDRPSAGSPVTEDASCVVPVEDSSRTKTSARPLLSPGARLVALEVKASTLPSPESAGCDASASICAPVGETAASVAGPSPSRM